MYDLTPRGAAASDQPIIPPSEVLPDSLMRPILEGSRELKTTSTFAVNKGDLDPWNDEPTEDHDLVIMMDEDHGSSTFSLRIRRLLRSCTVVVVLHMRKFVLNSRKLKWPDQSINSVRTRQPNEREKRAC